MRVPLSWLKKYVSISISPEELAHRLTMAGTEVSKIEYIGSDWDREKVLIGRVLKVDPHPNADRLTIPIIELGNCERMAVVCGAPNVAAEQKIAFAMEGAQLFSPHTGRLEPLKATTIRGVLSAGMVCSELELGLSDNHEGILVLDADAPIGMPLADYLGDAILHIDVTPNRPDCLSMLGVSREVAALTDTSVKEPRLSYPEGKPTIESLVKIKITDPDLCHRYTASLVRGLKVGPSPKWMQDALIKVGQRPINNVVDITNYVMFEYGQPLHAFDFDTVKESTVLIRAAHPGETFVTLDGEERTLTPPVLTIADATDVVGLAGIMGGANSQVHDGSKSVLLESANFSPINTRRTTTTLHLTTEASHRFERSIRADLAPLALKRATQLILQLAGGEAAQGIIDLYPGQTEPATIRLSSQRIKQVLGVDFNMAEAERVLRSLGIERAKPSDIQSSEREGALLMGVPYWRSDISIEDDLVEEIARITGYDAIPTTMLSAPIPNHQPQDKRMLKERLKDLLATAGMREIISYSLTNLVALGKVGALESGPQPIKIANPMSSELEYLRTSLRANVLQALAHNRRVSLGDGIRIFEIGRVYLQQQDGDLPKENDMLVGVLSGPRLPISWHTNEGDMDFFDAKAVLDWAFGQLNIHMNYEPSDDPILHPGKTARLLSDSDSVGVIGEVHPSILEDFDLEGTPAVLFEVDLELLIPMVQRIDRHYQSTSRFPESHRDVALTVNANVTSAQVRDILDRHQLVAHSTPFDLYSGPGIPVGKKSLAYRIVFQSASGTLTSEQVDSAQEEILHQLQKKLGAELRG